MNIRNYPTKLALASIALVSAVSFAPSAMAQSATFNFSENITPSCDLAGLNTAAGSTVDLQPNSSQNGLLTANPATFSIACNFDGATINITGASEDLAPSAATALTATLTKTNDSTSSISNGSTGNNDLILEGSVGGFANDFELGLTTDHSGNGLIAGTYNYSVVISVAGN